MVSAVIREAFIQNPKTRKTYIKLRSFYHRIQKIHYIFWDLLAVCRYMKWEGEDEKNYWAASAELLFQYHKLEKGLCMPGKARFFGYDPSKATLELLTAWRQKGYDQNDTVYIGALATLKAYATRIASIDPEKSEVLRSKIWNELSIHSNQNRIHTPIDVAAPLTHIHSKFLSEVLQARRSQRIFSGQSVPVDLITQAITMAQLSPSACNRQPWHVHSYEDRAKMEALLNLQNGNRGFGHTIPRLLIITSESRGFFDASERHEPYIDGGLFAMSLILSLQSLGLSTCCLNWCVSPGLDKKAHIIGEIAESELIIMYLAVGYAEPGSQVPASPRRDLSTVFVKH